MSQLWCIHKVKEFESNSQQYFITIVARERCDVSTKLKNLKATHNIVWRRKDKTTAVMYPQS